MKAIALVAVLVVAAASVLVTGASVRRERQQTLNPPKPAAAPPAVDAYEDLRLNVFAGTHPLIALQSVPVEAGSRIKQRVAYDYANRIFCESSADIHALPEVVEKLVLGRWTWWLGGKQTDRKETPRGTEYMLYPAWLGVKVHEFMHKPEAFTGPGGGRLIRIDFLADSGSFASGRGYFLIQPLAGGRTRLFGRFAAVNSLVLPHAFFTETHLKGERGHLFGGLLKAGWWHLIEIAEGREVLPNDYSLITPPAGKP